MPLPGMGESRDVALVAKVREWVRSEVLDDDVTIVVAELACTEPGCPPVETVIGLLREGEQRQCKVHKPLSDVTEADVASALAGGHA